MYSQYNIPGSMPGVPTTMPGGMPPTAFKEEPFDYSQFDLNPPPQQQMHQSQQPQNPVVDLSLGYDDDAYTLDNDNKRKMSPSESPSDGADDESPGDDENDAKKPRKPGRKPETTMPASKRKAQNRAAQRAFRERKEKHLRDLETKISQLEGESASKNSENEFLRFQVERLQNELKLYKDKSGAPAPAPISTDGPRVYSEPIAEMTAKPFTFEFPTYSPPPKDSYNAEREAREQLQREQIRGYLQRKPSSVASDTTSPASQASSNQSPCTNPSAYTSPQNGMNSKPLVGATAAAVAANPGNKDPHVVDFCAELSKACINKAEMLSKAHSPTTTIPSPSTTVSSTAPALSASVATAGSDVPGSDFLFDMPFDMDFMSYRDPQSETHLDDFSLPELTTETSMFDPLDPLADKDLIAGRPLTIKKEADEEELMLFSQPKTLMNCTAVWDRITSHPKFGDIDIEGLCSELRNKAKCSESGVVLTELDVDGVLSTFQ